MKKTFLLLMLLVLSIVGAKADESVTITVTSEDVTDGTYYYKLFVSDQAQNYTYAYDDSHNVYGTNPYTNDTNDGFKAYIVTGFSADITGAKFTLDPVTAVPANTPVLVRVKTMGEYQIDEPYVTPEAVTNNKLTVAASETALVDAGALLTASGKDVYFTVPEDENATVSAGQIYLSLTADEYSDLAFVIGYAEIGLMSLPTFAYSDAVATVVDNIAGLNGKTGSFVVTLNDALVTYVAEEYDDYYDEYQGAVIIEDASGAIALNNTGISSKVSKGDKLNGTLAVNIAETLYGRTVALGSDVLDNFDEYVTSKTSGNAVEPLLIDENTDEDILGALEWRYVKAQNVEVSTVSVAGYYSTDDEPALNLEDLIGDKFYIADQFGAVYTGWNSFPVEVGGVVDFTGFLYSSVDGDGNALPAFQPTAITTPVTIGEAGVATFSSANRLDFSNSEKIAAYIATVDGTTVTFTKVEKVPANTGVLLRSVDGGAVTEDISVVVETADDTTGNALVPSDGSSVAGKYILANGSNGIGFYKAGATNSLAEGKAYLDVPGTARFIGFDGETTGISEVETGSEAAVVYNLNGQRVAKTVKGLNIVNGKKVIVK